MAKTVTEEQLKTLEKVFANVRRYTDHAYSRDARQLAPYVFDDIADVVAAYRELAERCNSSTN